MRGQFSARADLLRADARQHRLPATRRARWRGGSRACSRTPRWSSPPSASCAALPARATAPARSPVGVYELSEFLVDVLGVEDVGATFPHRVATTRPATRCARCGSATRRCGCCERVRGHRARRADDADECCGFGGTFAVKNADTSMAMLADKLRARARHRRRGLHRGRQLVPDAHRRWRCAASAPACAPCTWPRSWRRT